MKASEIREALSRAEVEKEEVPVPEAWQPHLNGARIFLKGFTARERDAYITEGADEQGILMRDNMSARLVAAMLVDEEGEHVFSGPEGVEALGEMPASALAELWERASYLSGLRSEQQEAAARDFADAQTATSSIE